MRRQTLGIDRLKLELTPPVYHPTHRRHKLIINVPLILLIFFPEFTLNLRELAFAFTTALILPVCLGE